MPQTISIHTVSEKLIMRLNFNGVPIAYDLTGKGVEVDDQANEWGRKGRNALDLILDWPGSVPFHPGVAKANSEVRSLSKGVSSASVEPLVALKWPSLHTPETYPQRLQGEFKQPDFPELRLWRECEVLSEITDTDRALIAVQLGKLHSAYARGDANQVCELIDFRLDDVAMAFGDDRAKLLGNTREMVNDMAVTSGWGMAELNPKNLEYELVAENRVVWVTGPAKEESLRSKRTKSFEWSMQTYFGRVAGAWKLVR